ncbi:uncharacterized protein ACN427_002938 isoform 1-T1 [Glossina fuscipes fuscipes]
MHNPPLHYRSATKRSKNSDPFERDPFKIQSYNFHYAERPSYPMQGLQQRLGTPSTFKCFDNFFFNYRYPHSSARPRTAVLSNTNHMSRNMSSNNYNKENKAAGLTKYQQSRRRSFVQEQGRTSSIFNNNSFDTSAGSASRCNIFSNNTPKSISGTLLRNSTRASVQTLRPVSCNFRGTSPSGVNACHPNSLNNGTSSTTTTNLATYRSGSQSLLEVLRRESRSRLPASSTTALYTNKTPIRDNSATRSLSPLHRAAMNSFEQQTKLSRKTSNEIIRSKSGSINIGKSHKFGSGCEIKINIKPLDSKAPGENVIIKIESDGLNKNLNYNKPLPATTKLLTNSASTMKRARCTTLSPDTRYNIKRAESSQTFIVHIHDDNQADKRLRRSSESIQRQEEQRLKNNQVQKEKQYYEALQAAYGNRTSNTAQTSRSSCRRIASHERLPSLVSWKINDDLSSCIQKKVIDNLPTSPDKNFFQKIRDKSSCSNSDLRPHTSSRIDQNEYLPSCSNSRSGNVGRPSEEKEHKILNTANTQTSVIGGVSSQTARSLRATKRQKSLVSLYKQNNVNNNNNNKRITSMHSMPVQNARQSYDDLKPVQPLLYRSKSTKLPFNFSINVFADQKDKIRV